MRHKISYKKLNRTSEHRKALFKNMLNSLIKYEQIVTTLPKAKELKPKIDKVFFTLFADFVSCNFEINTLVLCKLSYLPKVINLSACGCNTFAFGSVVVICSYFTSELSIFFINAFLCSDVLFSFL